MPISISERSFANANASAIRGACALALALSFLGCNDKHESSASKVSAEVVKKPGHVEWVKIPGTADPQVFMQAELARAAAEQKKVVLYVGARWCEPCQRFHEAAKSGALDAELGDVRFVDLDHDDHATVIEALGCESKLIPLFSVPSADGRCSDRRVEGGIKGGGAVGFILPKLLEILR